MAADFFDVETNESALVEIECWSKLRAPHDLVVGIGVARIDGLPKRIVESFYQDENLGLHFRQIISRSAVKRAVLRDRVHHRPRERKEDHVVALELEERILALQPAIHRFHRHQEAACAQFDQVVGAPVHDSELQADPSVVRCNQHLLAEADACGRTREAPVQQTGRDGKGHESHQRLEGRDCVRQRPARVDVSIPYRRQRMRAEKERIQEPATGGAGVCAFEMVDPNQQVNAGKKQVCENERRQHEQGKFPKRNVDEVKVWMAVTKPDALASYIEVTAGRNGAFERASVLLR